MPSTVYSITHRETGREYIGVTSRSVEKRWTEHRCSKRPDMPIGRAIRKYGADAFDFRVEGVLPTFDEAKIAEMIAIALRHPRFNATTGGDGSRGAVRSAETRAKLSTSAKARGIPPKMSAAAIAANTGAKRSPETRAKIGAAHKGRIVSAETRQRISAGKRGRKLKSGHDEAWRALMSAKLKGRVFSAETRARMSASAKARMPKCR